MKNGTEDDKNGEHLRGCHHPESQGGNVGKGGERVMNKGGQIPLSRDWVWA